jgi:tRNA threonylcarbamoyl adenosine modification protein YeaZ
MLDRILSRNGTRLKELDGIGIASGPGSFTGIRIGQATIAGISLSAGIPVYGVSTLEAMAVAMETALSKSALFQSALPEGSEKNGTVKLIPMLDAGRGNSYFAVFSTTGTRDARSARSARSALERISEDRLVHSGEIAEEAGDGLFFGEGAEKYKDALEGTGRKVILSEMPVSLAACAAVLGIRAVMEGSKGDIFRLKPNYIHGGPATTIQQPN